MIPIVVLEPHQFTKELIRPIFEEVDNRVPADREVKLDLDYIVKQWQALSKINMTWAAVDAGGKAFGLLGALFITEFWSGLPMAMEQFWFVNSSHRWSGAGGELFDKFEEEAKRRKCQTIWAGSNVYHKPDKMAKVYATKGYQYWGQNFRKLI
jgi:hypothetical protein